MSDLISREEVLKIIQPRLNSAKKGSLEFQRLSSIMDSVKEIPTSYDAEKVDKEILEYFKGQINKKPDGWDLVDFSHDIRNIVRNGGEK